MEIGTENMDHARGPEDGRQPPTRHPSPVRIADDRAARVLDRAAALDAKRNSEIEVDQLREAAAGAGISREAFEEAMREVEGEARGPRPDGLPGLRAAPSQADFAYFTQLFRDVLGDDGQLTVVGDRIEWRDDEGLTVSVNPTRGATTAAVSAEGRLRSRLVTIFLSTVIPLLVTFMLAFEDEDAALGALIAILMMTFFAVVGSVFAHRRERKRLRKKVDRLRRQLQHLLGPGPEGWR